MTFGRIVAALLLPPLAVFLAEGVSRNFWICVGLTCLAFIPGIVFAFYTIAKAPADQPPAAAGPGEAATAS